MQQFAYRNDELFCEDLALRLVAESYGTPLYVYSKRTIIEHCRDIASAFGGRKHRICYAVKANANRTLLQQIADEGLGADVGSKGELHLALGAGFKPDTITFSGVGKRDDEIEYALMHRILAFDVESVQEIEVINEIAGRLGSTGRILLRVNLDIDAGGHAYISTSKRQNKFGIPCRKAREVLQWASALPHIDVRGVHSHIGSQITDVAIFLNAAQSLARLVKELREAGLSVPDLDFGGGYGVQYHGYITHGRLPAETPEGLDCSTVTMLQKLLPILEATGCTISIQPGRSIMAQAGVLLVQVLYRKETGEKTFIIVDGGMNDLLRPSLYRAHHQIVPLAIRTVTQETVDVVGPVCESGDFFAQDRKMLRSDRGDLLAIVGTGAYGYVLSSNYNARLRPAEILVDGTSHTLIRKRETVDAL